MITTYWRIPNIFTISQEHKGKTTGNGANFPTLHSNKPEQRSEKINVETWRRRGLDAQKAPEEALVGAPRVSPREDGEQRSGIAQLHFAGCKVCKVCVPSSAPGSLLRKEISAVFCPWPVLCFVPANIPGLGNAAQGRTGQSLSLRGTGTGWGLPGLGLSIPSKATKR